MFLSLIIVLSYVVGYVYSRRTPKGTPLPPGPPGDPLIGHLRMVPPENQDILFYEWGKIYGDVIYLNILGRPFIVLNSVRAATDLLDKRSANYSDRPPFVIYEMMGWVASLTLLRYGKQFQRHRRMLQTYLSARKCIEYQPVQMQATRVLLQSLVSDDNGRDKSVQRYAVTIIMRIAYGHQVTSDDDPYIKVAQDAADAVTNAGPPGSTPVDFFPFLRHLPSWFPGAYYAAFSRDHKPVVDKLYNYPFERNQKETAEGKAEPSFLSTQLDTLQREGAKSANTIEDIKGATSLLYFGGSDTTSSTMSIFLLAMVLNPECQVEAQKEIDAVIGSGRLPEFSDRPSLPYVECVFQETLRWNSAVPLEVPHRSLKDDVYNGMFIPAGSVIIPNTRGMTLDESIYTDPAKFNPTRFLPKPKGNSEPHPIGPFGFGRRICPGRHLADASVWIAIASILTTLTISKAVDDDGKEITPKVAFTSGIVNHPYPFKSIIRPRSEAARALISQVDTSSV